MTHVHQLIFFAHFWCLFFWDNIWQIFNFHWLQNACRKRSVANMKRRKFAPSAEMSFVFSLCLRMWTRKCVCFGFGCVARVRPMCIFIFDAAFAALSHGFGGILLEKPVGTSGNKICFYKNSLLLCA